MKPKERVQAVLNGSTPDRIPRFEVWIDGLFEELGVSEPFYAHPETGQDVLLLPSTKPQNSAAWDNGTDEFGRVWKNGIYAGGALKTYDDLKYFTPSLKYALEFFDEKQAALAAAQHPDHFPFFGTHIGPFMGTYMAMGLSHMFRMLRNDPSLVKAVIESRTEWCLAVFKRSVELGARLIVVGDDSAHGGGPFLSPANWRKLVLPHHRRLVNELPVPVIWHSDGKIADLLPFAIESGFAGIHGLEPGAGNDLGKIKHQYGQKLILLGNVDVKLLCGKDLEAVRSDLRRCLKQGGKNNFMLSSSNSIFPGMNTEAVKEYLSYELD